jgi:hypothetical protein
VRLVLLDKAFLLEQRLEHALDGVSGAQRLLEPCPPRPRRNDRQLPGPNRVETAAVEDEWNPRREEGLADDEAAAAADLDDEAIRQRR